MRDPGFPSSWFALDRTLGVWPLHAPAGGSVHAGPHPLELAVPVASDLLSGWDGFLLRVENPGGWPLRCGLRLECPGGAAFVTGGREEVPPGGETDLFFPGECFGLAGGPARWGSPGAVRLVFRRPRDADQPRDIRVRVLGLGGLRREIPPGPRLGAEGLDQVLACSRILGQPRREWGAFRPGGEASRVPPPPVFFFPGDTPGRVRTGRIMGQAVGLPPDWGAGPPGNLEWSHFLHRHHFLRALARAVRRGQAGPGLLPGVVRSWIAGHPVPVGSDGGASPAWETLSVAFRLREWFHAAGAVWHRPECGPDMRGLWLRSIWEHARHLRDHRGHPGNWRMLEAASLALAGLLFPEFREAEAWAGTGLARLEEEVSRQFLADGGHWEISPLYHGLCAQACLEVRETARRLGRPFPRVVEERLPQAFDFLSALARPDFTWPSINDSGGAAGDFRVLLRFAGKALDREDFLWAGSRGRQGRPPEHRMRVFPRTGLAVCRTGFTGQDHGLLFRAGPAGTSHGHGDTLSLEYWAHGRPVLVDPGISGYASTLAAGLARRAGAHTMPLVDGRGPDLVPRFPGQGVPLEQDLISSQAGGAGTLLGSYSVGGVQVERLVVFFPDGSALVRDRFTGHGVHEVSTCWQFMPGCAVRQGEGLSVRVTVADGQVLTLAALPVKMRPDLGLGRGLVSLRGRDVPAPALDIALRGPLPLVLMALLTPADPPPVQAARRTACPACRPERPAPGSVPLSARFTVPMLTRAQPPGRPGSSITLITPKERP